MSQSADSMHDACLPGRRSELRAAFRKERRRRRHSAEFGDAINRGLKANLGLLTNEQSSREVRAERFAPSAAYCRK